MRRSLRLLVVEDDPDTLDFMQVLLVDLGHEVVLCRNGREALDTVEGEAPFDLVIIDMQMPQIDGVETVLQLRQHAPTAELPILCMSARTSGKTEKEGLAAGCDFYLTKPCWEEQILDAMRRVLLRRGRLGPDEDIE